MIVHAARRKQQRGGVGDAMAHLHVVDVGLCEPDGHGHVGVLADHADVVGADQAAGVALAAVVDEVRRRGHRVE